MLECFPSQFREEIDRINSENNVLETQLKHETDKNKEEARNRKQLEKVLGDAANALKQALRVRFCQPFF